MGSLFLKRITDIKSCEQWFKELEAFSKYFQGRRVANLTFKAIHALTVGGKNYFRKI